MPLNPAGRTIMIGGSATLIVDTLTYTVTTEDFDRLEYDNRKIASAENSCGQKRLTGQTLFLKPFQIVSSSCSDTSSVPLWPNSDATFAQVAQRFDIKRYSITGAMSENDAINAVYELARQHQEYLAQFRAYQKRAAGDTPYASLIALQSNTFSYLTATGISAAGTALDNAESNILITRFSAETQLAIAKDNTDTSFDYYKTFQLEFDVRSIHSLAAFY